MDPEVERSTSATFGESGPWVAWLPNLWHILAWPDHPIGFFPRRTCWRRERRTIHFRRHQVLVSAAASADGRIGLGRPGIGNCQLDRGRAAH